MPSFVPSFALKNQGFHSGGRVWSFNKTPLGADSQAGLVLSSPVLHLGGLGARSQSTKVIRPGSFRSVGAVVADIFRFLDQHNLNPKRYRWTADPKLRLNFTAPLLDSTYPRMPCVSSRPPGCANFRSSLCRQACA
jgi:hypothetical protein